jgi:large subunit ribosomal protein L24
MPKFHVKKGDEVVVIAGAETGKRGKILRVITKKNRVTVEGVKMVKKHRKRSGDRPQGDIIELEGSIHVSNVMLAGKFDAKAAKRATATAATA